MIMPPYFFLAAGFFLATFFLAAGFLVAFFAAGFFAAGFLTVGFFAAGFLAAGFLAATYAGVSFRKKKTRASGGAFIRSNPARGESFRGWEWVYRTRCAHHFCFWW